jgi:hypothetical protein
MYKTRLMLASIHFISSPIEPQYPKNQLAQPPSKVTAARYTHQVNLIKLHLDILIPLLRSEHNPSSPRHINILIGVSLESIVHATIQHDLIIATEVDLHRRVST